MCHNAREAMKGSRGDEGLRGIERVPYDLGGLVVGSLPYLKTQGQNSTLNQSSTVVSDRQRELVRRALSYPMCSCCLCRCLSFQFLFR